MRKELLISAYSNAMLNLLTKMIYLVRLPYRNPEYLSTMRLNKLKKLITHAKTNVSFYRDRFGHVDPHAFASLEDIGNLPITNPMDLRQAKPEDILDPKYPQNQLRLQSTSGTSGMPFLLFNSYREETYRQLKFIRFLFQHGWKPWWKGVYLWRDTQKRTDSIFQRLINKRKFFVSINLPVQEQVRNILAIRPHFIFGMTASLDFISTWMLANSVSYKGSVTIITAGATLTSEISDKFKKVFNHPGLDTYSFVEGGLIGGTCHCCSLKCFDDDGCIVEALDENNEPVKAGGKGRAVITVLDQFSTPIIRYDIGDYITLAPKQISCKNNFTHFSSIDGRQADTLRLSDGRILQYQHLAVINRIEGIKQFQFLLKRDDALTIKYVKKPGADAGKIEQNILEQMGLKNYPRLCFEQCESIPLESSGKFKRIKMEVESEPGRLSSQFECQSRHD